MKTTKENIHENHRSRMRDRFVKSPDSLSNHELLELALFYAVPRVNVNPLAHTLINKYGSLSAVTASQRISRWQPAVMRTTYIVTYIY